MRHDRAYKALFSHPLAVRDLLREFVAEQLEGGCEWVERLDFSTLEPLPTERIDPTLRARTNDLVWRVRFRDPADGPEWLHVLLMLEFQSSVDWFMALRVQGYAVRLYESLWQDRRPGQDDRLPALLAVVVYNGKASWTAATALADLVGAAARPQAGTGPPFAGESYVLVDVGAYEEQELPLGNLVSLVVAAERMMGPGDAAEVLEGALRLLASAEQEPLRETFLGWFRQLVGRAGVDLEFLEDRARMEQMEQSGALRTTLEERFRAMHDAFRAEGEERGLEQGLERGLVQGLEQGLERERQLLVRQAGRKFGTHIGEAVAGLLAGIDDPDRLQDVGEWIVDCGLGSELLARIQGTE